MSVCTFKLEIGTKLRYQGAWYTLVGVGGHGALLRSDEGGVRCVAFSLLLSDESLATEASLAAGLDAEFELATDLLASVPDAARARAEELLGHLNEVTTGFRSGDTQFALEGEPREEYNPTLTTQEQRIQAKRAETGMARATIFRQLRAYRRFGLLGLVDGNAVRQTSDRGRFEPKVDAAVVTTLDTLTFKSKVSIAEIYRLVDEELERQGSAALMPPKSTFYKKVAPYLKERGFHNSARYRRSAARRPSTPYGKIEATRPGERVLIDISPWDVFAVDSITGRTVCLELALGFDLCSGSIVAGRFTPKSAGGIDATLLLADIVWPKPMLPGFAEEALWPYVGIPEELVLYSVGIKDPAWRPAGVPFVHPEVVAVDNGRIFVSQTFQDACQMLGTSVDYRRKRRPTDGSHIERVFRTIREGLVEKLPGYRGPDVHSRGERVEADAFLFVDELEALFWEWVATVYQRRPRKGLHLPGRPLVDVSPNDLYELGLSQWGFLHVPVSPDLHYELLETRWVKRINNYGIELDRLRYDGEALNPYRKQRSSYNGRFPGRWPVKIDRRDRSRIFFKDPADGTWAELMWRGHREVPVPFSDAVLRYAKTLVASRPDRSPGDLDEVLKDLLGRFRHDAVVDRRERMLSMKQNLRDHQLEVDRRRLEAVGAEPIEGGDVIGFVFDLEGLDASEIAPLGVGGAGRVPPSPPTGAVGVGADEDAELGSDEWTRPAAA